VGKKKRRIPRFEPLEASLIDTHCHLLSESFGKEVGAAVERLREGGVERVVNIGAGYGLDGNREVLRLHRTYPFLHPTIGVHPHDAHILIDQPDAIDVLREMAETHPIVAFGEIGLDYYYENAPIDVQKEALRLQLSLALRLGVPLVIHTRDANEDTLDILDRASIWELGVVFHCFSGDWRFAQACLERGAHLSLSGIVTFPRAEALHEVAMKMPLERMLVETDSPFLAPVPYRGRRNEPSYLHATVRRIAALREVAPEVIARETSDNARRFFHLPT